MIVAVHRLIALAAAALSLPTLALPTASAAPAPVAPANGRIFFIDGSTGQLVSVLPDGTSRRTYPGQVAAPAVSPDGTRVAVELPTGRGIGLENADGTDLVTLVPDAGSNPSWSPDGTRLVYSADDDLAIVDVVTGAVTRVTQDGSTTQEVHPAWSADGRYLAYTVRGCHDGGGTCLERMDVDGTHRLALTPYDGEINVSDDADWSLTNQIAYSSSIDGCPGAGGIDIWTMGRSGGNKTNLTCAPAVYNSDDTPTWAPNGKKIAFVSDERSGGDSSQLYVRTLGTAGATAFVDTGSAFGLSDPDWAARPAAQHTTTTLTATPTAVRAGKRVTLSGTMTPASGQGYGGQSVVLKRRAAGTSGAYTVLKSVVTAPDGTWTTAFYPSASLELVATYAANPALGFGASNSAPVTVTVG